MIANICLQYRIEQKVSFLKYPCLSAVGAAMSLASLLNYKPSAPPFEAGTRQPYSNCHLNRDYYYYTYMLCVGVFVCLVLFVCV